MLSEDILCFECGGDAIRVKHADSCTSVYPMSVYVEFLSLLEKYPTEYLNKVEVRMYAERMERDIRKGECI